MDRAIQVRERGLGDTPSIEHIYLAAFPDEDLLPVVRELLRETRGVLSLVAVSDDAVVGHVVFTICTVADGAGAVALLAPLAVLPGWQGQDVGSAIVGEGCRRMEEVGVDWVYVLGDPGYYGRFEFAADDGVDPPYPLPAEWRAAWQSLGLGERAVPARGKLWVPQPWRQENLWSA